MELVKCPRQRTAQEHAVLLMYLPYRLDGERPVHLALKLQPVIQTSFIVKILLSSSEYLHLCSCGSEVIINN